MMAVAWSGPLNFHLVGRGPARPINFSEDGSRGPDSSERHRISCNRAIAPYPPHTAAQDVFGDTTGAAVQLGERGEWEGALAGTGLLGPRYGGGSYKKGNPTTGKMACINVITRYCTHYRCTAVHGG